MRKRSSRRPKGRLRRFVRRTVLLVAVLGAAAAGGWWWWQREVSAVKLGAGAPQVRLRVPLGANAESIGRDLQAAGLTTHPLAFRLLARLRGVSGQLKAGEYRLQGPLSLEQVLDLLVRGDVVQRTVTVPEGRTVEEAAAIAGAQGLDRGAFLRAARDVSGIRDLDPEARDLEGYLFPDTYQVPQTADAEAVLVRRMLQRFREVVTPQLARLPERGLDVRRLVTLASIVEAETGQAEERPRIAAVFHNRLRLGMPLQTDPTVIYALKQAGRWDGNIRRADLQIDSPYNTYRYPGLPPGPIGCPGREALLAVLDPASTKELYFVSRNDGTHHFSETLVEHNRAVDRYQRRRTS